MNFKHYIFTLLLLILGNILFFNWYSNCLSSSLTLSSCVQPILATNEFKIILNLLAATVAGFFIGLERSIHGRPAGLRTHMLVCLSSSLLMLITVYQLDILPHLSADVVRIDPTRMGQGIMTGIGFLGVGVIMKEGLTIRGLTTAASIWMTAAIGILLGIGFFLPAIITTILTLAILSLIRKFEHIIPTKRYARLKVQTSGFKLFKDDLIRVINESHVDIRSDISYNRGGLEMEYSLTICSDDRNGYDELVKRLDKEEQFISYELNMIGD